MSPEATDPAVTDRVVAWEALVDRLLASEPRLSPLGAGILAALALDLAQDSRSFAQRFGLAHALVLREVLLLSESPVWLTLGPRMARTQRQPYAMTAKCAALFQAAHLS